MKNENFMALLVRLRAAHRAAWRDQPRAAQAELPSVADGSSAVFIDGTHTRQVGAVVGARPFRCLRSRLPWRAGFLSVVEMIASVAGAYMHLRFPSGPCYQVVGGSAGMARPIISVRTSAYSRDR